MSRTSRDEFRGGVLWNGFDYKNQAWVEGGKYVRCGHPESMACGCYGRDHEGEPTKGETQPDVSVANHGTLFTFTPLTERAKEWMEENVQSEPWQWLGNSLTVEHRYAGELANGMVEHGLVVV